MNLDHCSRIGNRSLARVHLHVSAATTRISTMRATLPPWVLLSLLVLPACALFQPSEKVVRVETEPPGAVVNVNGLFAGRTPCDCVLPRTKGTVAFVILPPREGFTGQLQGQQRTFTWRELPDTGAVLYFDLRLAAAPREPIESPKVVKVETYPPGAMVNVNGVLAGTAPFDCVLPPNKGVVEFVILPPRESSERLFTQNRSFTWRQLPEAGATLYFDLRLEATNPVQPIEIRDR